MTLAKLPLKLIVRPRSELNLPSPCFRHRSFGSAAINMICVAQGTVDAYVEYGIHSWDVAAAALVVQEAGGVLLDPTGTHETSEGVDFAPYS